MTLTIAGSAKDPDYWVGIHGIGGFFVELKKLTDRTANRRQIDATENRSINLVYALYELTEDDIRIVEEATA